MSTESGAPAPGVSSSLRAPRLGAHESVAGGLHLAFERIHRAGGEALQIFSRNQRQWEPTTLSDLEVAQFAEAWSEYPDMPVISHGSYLVNLATNKPEVMEKSVTNLTLELTRCGKLSIPWVVLHPGSHLGDGVEEGLKRVVAGLDRCFAASDNGVGVLVETTAGQGTGLGSRFEELAYILSESRYPELLGVCVDTCHIFAAGYELRSPEGYRQTMDSLDASVGLDRIKLFHLNDSKRELGSRVDRHDHIGKGEIGTAGFANLLNDARFAGLPMTLETPKEDDLEDDRVNLATLRGLLTGAG